MQSWDRSDSWHQEHDNLHWTACYEKDCTTHESEKQEEYYSQASKEYHKKKEMRWATWNAKKSKIAHQVDELSEKFNSKSKSLRTEWEEMIKRVKTTSFWWEKRVIYNSELIAQQLALMKVSEKHQESEKSKKNQIQTLSSDASELLIN